MEFWAIHPCGRRIIEEAQNGLGVTEEQATDSWAVLDQYGNMLAPTVMFVSERIINRHKEALKRGEKGGIQYSIAFSFSPGVGAEGILLRQLYCSLIFYLLGLAFQCLRLDIYNKM